jgi:hypothetical protein
MVRKFWKGDASDESVILKLFGRWIEDKKSYISVTRIINPGRTAPRMNSKE